MRFRRPTVRARYALPLVILAAVGSPSVGQERAGLPTGGAAQVAPQQSGGGRWNHRGPARGGHGIPRHRSALSFSVGFGPGVFWTPGYAIPYLPPAWSYGYASPFGIYYNPSSNRVEYYLPPVYAPAELAYGPLATERFLGLTRDVPLAPAPVAPPAAAVTRARDAADIAARLRKSNDASKDRGRRFISFGDALFLKQRYHEAVQRYKSAIEAAPDLAEAYVHEGFALIAIGRYTLAAKALKIALHLEPGVMRAGFQLDDLYGDNRLAKTAHIEALARATLDDPRNADLYFLVAVVVYADGDAERAARFFAKARELAGPGADFLAPFLPPGEAPDSAPAADGADTEMDT